MAHILLHSGLIFLIPSPLRLFKDMDMFFSVTRLLMKNSPLISLIIDFYSDVLTFLALIFVHLNNCANVDLRSSIRSHVNKNVYTVIEINLGF